MALVTSVMAGPMMSRLLSQHHQVHLRAQVQVAD